MEKYPNPEALKTVRPLELVLRVKCNSKQQTRLRAPSQSRSPGLENESPKSKQTVCRINVCIELRNRPKLSDLLPCSSFSSCCIPSRSHT